MAKVTPDQVAAGLAQMLETQADVAPYLVADNVAEGGETVFLPDAQTDRDIVIPPRSTAQIPRRLERDYGLARLCKSGFLSLRESDTLPAEPTREPELPPQFAEMDNRYIESARQIALAPNSEPAQQTLHLFDNITADNILRTFDRKKGNRAEAVFFRHHYPTLLRCALFFDDTYHLLSKSQRKHAQERAKTLEQLGATLLPFI